MKMKLFVIINVDFKIAVQLLIICSAFIKYLEKRWKNNEAVHYLFIDCKKAYYSGRRGDLNIIFSLRLLSITNY